MKLKHTLAALSLVLAGGVAVVTATTPQDHGPMVAKEMSIFDGMEGVWDGQLTMWMAGQAMGPSPCTETVTRALGGQWVDAAFEMDYMGMPFTGKVLTGWDRLTKDYVNIWINSGSGIPTISRGTYDAEKKQIDYRGTGESMLGGMSKQRSVVAMPDADNRSLTIYEIAEDGSETKTTLIEYTRHKEEK